MGTPTVSALSSQARAANGRMCVPGTLVSSPGGVQDDGSRLAGAVCMALFKNSSTVFVTFLYCIYRLYVGHYQSKFGLMG